MYPQDYIKNKIEANAAKWVSTLERIPTDKIVSNPNRPIMNNKQCMNNAMNECLQNHAVCIVECVLFNGSKSVAHYINMDASGKFYDCTLGWNYSRSDYRLVRYINPRSSECGNMVEVLIKLKTKLYEQSPKWLRAIHNADENIF